MENCKQFIVDVLKQKGAMNVELLLEACTTSITNCPKILKSVSHEEFKTFCSRHSNTFIIKQDEICLIQYEEKYKTLLTAEIKKGGCTISTATDILITCDKSTSKYIQAQGKEKGVKDFLSRNDDIFVCEDEEISTVLHSKLKESDDKAIQYFLKFLSEKGTMDIKKLSGHWNQAPDAVKNIVTSTSPEVFRDFLTRNSFYFTLDGSTVSKQAAATNSLTVEVDEYECSTVKYFVQKILLKGALTLQQLVSCLNLDGTIEIIGTVGSRKLGDVETFLYQHPKIFCIRDENVTLQLQDHSSISVTANKLSSKATTLVGNEQLVANHATCNGSEKNEQINQVNQLEEKCEAIFSDLFGQEFFVSLQHLLNSINVKSFRFVEVLWFDVGRKPSVKVLTESATVKYVIHELKDQPKVTVDALNTMLDKERISKISETCCGIQGSLSTIRLNLLGKSVVGLTMFYQTHSTDTENNFEEKEFGNLRAILYDNISTTSNILFSYMRRISHNFAEHYHVIIVDCNGKLTGYDPVPPPEVGKARRIFCSAFCNRSEVLLEAFAHNPDVIVTNCLDIMNQDTLHTIKQICEQGIQVIASVHSSCSKILDDSREERGGLE